MKVLTVLGSPRETGNTATVLGWVEEELREGGHDVDRVNLREHPLSGCVACYGCRMDDEFTGCAQTGDDANDIYRKMENADAIVFSAPLYMWSFPARMKALLDRSLCLAKGYMTENHRSVLNGKPVALLVTCMGSIENNADLIEGVFDRLSGFFKTRTMYKLIVPGTTDPDKLTPEVKGQAAELAKSLSKIS